MIPNFSAKSGLRKFEKFLDIIFLNGNVFLEEFAFFLESKLFSFTNSFLSLINLKFIFIDSNFNLISFPL